MNEHTSTIGSDIFKDIYFLYELSLAVGKSLNVLENCKYFVDALHALKNLDLAGVWIKNKYLTMAMASTPHMASLIYAVPRMRIDTPSISINHPIFKLSEDRGIFCLRDDDAQFKQLILEKNITQGAYAVFPLEDIGFLKLYSEDANVFTELELNKLRNVVDKFAVSMKGSLAHQTATAGEKKIRHIIESALDAVVIINSEGFVIEWNKQAELIFNWTKEEALNEQMANLIIPPKYRKLHYEGVRKYFKTGNGPILNTRIEIKAMRKSGEIFDVELAIVPIELNHTTFFSAFIRDITEAKKAKQALIEARQKAEASAKAKELFLANMSHEIRTPLNAIYGMSHLLLKTQINDHQQKYLDALKVSTNNLLVIVNDILDISKMASGKLSIENIGFNLTKQLQFVIQSELPKAQEKEIQLELNIAAEISAILIGDPVRLNQVLFNLVDNALKFTEQGSIKINGQLIASTLKEQEILLTIEDTGIGIDADKINHIFENFSQEDDSITRRFGGTGLGLAISKQLVELMNGRLWVESEKGVGTTFFIQLRCMIGQETDLPETAANDLVTYQLQGIKVLLVEDHEINQFLATSILKDLSIEVYVADNGLEAIEKLKKHDFDLILMDMQMPVMDGLEATRIIRKELKMTLPIIALTANATQGYKEKCLASGMNDFVIKPFDEIDLAKKMSFLLNKKPQTLAVPMNKKNRPMKMIMEDTNSHSTANVALYNLSKLSAKVKGNQQFIQHMIRLFVDRTPNEIAAIKMHFEKGELDRVHAIAHKLKPSFSLLDIYELAEDMCLIEQYAKAETNLEELAILIEKLERLGGKMILALSEELR